MINTSHDQKRIAILPFRDLLANQYQSPLLPGFTEDLIASFSRFTGISVISHFSTAHITDLADKSKIDKLEADYIIGGSLRAIADQIRIAVHLVNTANESVLFASEYDFAPEDILATQDTILEQLVGSLQQKIDFDILSHSYRKKQTELAAYENYLIGMDLLKKGSMENDEQARVHFKEALKIDPQFAPAYTGLSLSHFNEWSCQLWDRWDVSRNGAHAYALKAIEVDPNDYKALAILGRTYLFNEEFVKAEHCVRKSLRMNPNDADNLIQVAFTLMFLGYSSEAINLYEKAKDLNPFHKDIYFAYGSNFYFEHGDFEHCIALSDKVATDMCWVDFPAYIAAAHFHLGDYNKMWASWHTYLTFFKSRIAQSDEAIEFEAIQWQINVNPYRDATHLSKFWDFIKTNRQLIAQKKAAPKKAALEKPASRDGVNFIKKEANHWHVTYEGERITLKDSKGWKNITRLLTAPNESFHCLDLMGITVHSEDKIAAIDATSKRSYQARISQLQEQIEDATELGNIERVHVLTEEYEQVTDHLLSALGLAGKIREVGSPAEKARSAVTWRIRSAIKKITASHPKLGRHLSNSIQTGTYCSYTPERLTTWELST
ncbi:MAG: hypothetical protein AAF564_25750 [Bacteroidota bacterium]